MPLVPLNRMPQRYVQSNPYLRNGNRAITIGNRATTFRPTQSMHYPQVPRGLPRTYDPRIRDQFRGRQIYPQRREPLQVARRPFAPVQIVQQKKPGLVGNIVKFLLTPPQRNTAPKRTGFIGNMINYQRTRTKWGL